MFVDGKGTIGPPLERPQKRAEHIAERLRAQIVRRELADGDYLPVEAELCAFFETSRPTMREAFRILEVEGLLDIRRGGRYGPRVRAPDPAVAARSLGLLLQYDGVELRAVYDAFVQLVPGSARQLADHHSSDDLWRLAEQRSRIAAVIEDARAFVHESNEFSLLVVELAGNPVVAVLCRLLTELLRDHRSAMSAYFEARPGVRARRASEVLESTANIIELITAADAKVEEYFRSALASIVRKALSVPIEVV